MGNKFNEAKYISDIIKKSNTNHIIEPFCGSCGISLYLLLHNIVNINDVKFTFNDTDTKLIRFLEEVKNDNLNSFINKCKIHYDNFMLNKKLWSEFIKKCKNNDNLTLEEWYIFRKCIRYGSLLNFELTLNINDYKNLINIYKHNNVNLSNIDYTIILEKYKNDDNVLIYLDPPYYCSFNKGYVSDNSDYIYIYILEYIKICKCKIILSAKSNPIIDYLFKDYILLKYNKLYSITKRNAQHLIISNLL
jgi:DNA adenine methylase